MVNLSARREQFVDNMVTNAGWSRTQAEDHFGSFAPMFEIGNEIDFVLAETTRLRRRYPKIMVAPMLYRVEDNLLYLLREQ
jgi:carbonic anhydrase